MVSGVVTSDNDFIPLFILPHGQTLNTKAYIKCPEELVLTWIKKVASGRLYVWQQYPEPCHRSREMKCKLPRPGFELRSPIPFPTMITRTDLIGWGCRICRMHLCRELRPTPNECPGYDFKPSDGKSPFLKLWGMRSTLPLLLLPDTLEPGVVVLVKPPSMSQIEMFNHSILSKFEFWLV